MRKSVSSFLRRALREQKGQTLPFMALLMTGLMATAGLVVDVGHAYVVQGTLQNSANAAALAAAGYVYANKDATLNAVSIAKSYSGMPGDENAYSASTVSTYPTTKCLAILMPKGSSCTSTSAPNAVQVIQTTKVPTTFMALLGMKNLNVSATAVASMQGSSLPWNIAIIIDSTGSMASADSNCSNLTQFQCSLNGVQSLLSNVNPCPGTELSCDTSGANVRVSLFTFPNVLTAVNGAIPTVNGATNDSIADEINCNGSPATYSTPKAQPIAAPYTLPVPGKALPVYDASGWDGHPTGSTNDSGLNYLRYTNTVGSTTTTWDATYQITKFVSDYYDATQSTKLNSSSNLVKAVGYGSTKGCLTYTFGIDGPTGGGSHFGNTYLAGAIYSAQAALAAQSTGQNAMIILSDGDMNASYYQNLTAAATPPSTTPPTPVTTNQSLYGGSTSSNQYADANEFPQGPAGSEVGPTSSGYKVPAYYTPATIVAAQKTLGYDTLSSTPIGPGQVRNGTTASIGAYPDWFDQCQQAIQAGQYATNNSTIVFSVAYGASTAGCNLSTGGWNVGSTDSTSLGLPDTNATYSLTTLNPCVTMENIATNLNYFYSDYLQGGTQTNCNDVAHSTVALNEIFQSIATTFTTPRLLPNSVWGS